MKGEGARDEERRSKRLRGSLCVLVCLKKGSERARERGREGGREGGR